MHILKPLPGILPMPGRPFADPIALWLMNGLGNQVFDLTGNRNNGIFQGTGPSWTYRGKFGYAVLLPGTDERISFGTNVKGLSNTAGTVIAWFKSTKASLNNQYIFSHRTVATDNRVYLQIDQNADGGNFLCGFDDNAEAIDSGIVVENDRIWHQGAIAWDSAGAEGYLDGVSIGTDVGTMPALNGDVYIGINRGLTSPFGGPIDHAMIFDYTLIASEIKKLYRDPFCMFPETIMPEFAIAS